MRLTEWIYEEGGFSYGQRIEVGMVLSDESLTEYRRLTAAWRVLYGWPARLMPPRIRVRRLARMVAGIQHWFNLEAQELKYIPTVEEERAGLKSLTAEVGVMGTVNALAQKFGMDPDAVLRWEYAKVYGILRSDLKEFLYSRRLSEQYNRQK